jgi:dynein heavy chain, axonemal
MARWQELVTSGILDMKDNAKGVQIKNAHFGKIMENMVDIVRRDLNLLQRTLICAMMVLDVHARDVLQLMVDEEVSTIDNFNW